jgi:hypothetical protein
MAVGHLHVVGALRRLPVRHQRAVILRDVIGMSVKRTSEPFAHVVCTARIGRSPPTVKYAA